MILTVILETRQTHPAGPAGVQQGIGEAQSSVEGEGRGDSYQCWQEYGQDWWELCRHETALSAPGGHSDQDNQDLLQLHDGGRSWTTLPCCCWYPGSPEVSVVLGTGGSWLCCYFRLERVHMGRHRQQQGLQCQHWERHQHWPGSPPGSLQSSISRIDGQIASKALKLFVTCLSLNFYNWNKCVNSH